MTETEEWDKIGRTMWLKASRGRRQIEMKQLDEMNTRTLTQMNMKWTGSMIQYQEDMI